MTRQKDIEAARRLIEREEKNLGRVLTEVERGDLLADNRNDWSHDYICGLLETFRGIGDVEDTTEAE